MLGPGPQPPRRNRKVVIGAAALVGALVIGGGAYAAVSLTGSDKSGSSKADNNDGNITKLSDSALNQVDGITKHLPADTVAAAMVNLNPGAGETVSTLKFLRKFPSIQREAPTGDTLSDGLLKPLIEANGQGSYDTDIKPWFDGQVAVGADLRDGTTRPIIVVKIKDATKAKAGIAKLVGPGGTPPGVAIDGKYAVVAQTQAAANQVATDAKTKSLSSNDTFRDNMGKVPGDSPLMAWVDVKGLVQVAQKSLPNHSETADVQQIIDKLPGSMAASLRFDASYADLSVVTFGGTKGLDAGKNVGAKVAKLPKDTAVAVGIGGMDKGVRSAWTELNKNPKVKAQIQEQVTRVQQQLGVTLPDDVATLLGSQTIFAVGGNNLTDFGGLSVTDPTKAYDIATRVLGKLPPSQRSKVVVKKSGDGITVANSPAYAAELGKDGGLGDEAAFKNAVPNADKAAAVVYVNVARISAAMGSKLPPDAAPITSVGLSAVVDGNATALHLRLAVK